jgi:hypothetical protein
MAMFISLNDSRTNDFKKWSDAHLPGNDDDDNSGGATPIAINVPSCDDGEATPELAHRPWLVPGAGSSF